MKKIKLGIEALHVNMKHITGIERYNLLVLEALDKYSESNINYFDSIVIFTKEAFDVSEYNNLDIRFIETNLDNYETLVNSSGIDLLHCTFVPPTNKISVPVVYTLHDVGRYLYPEFMDQALMNDHINKLQTLLDNKKCTILTVSKASQKQIEDILNIPEEISYYAALYPNNSFRNRVKSMSHVYEYISKKNLHDYILVVGCFIPTKNVISIIEAYHYAKSNNYIPASTKLVIVGKEGWDISVENASRASDDILRLTDVSDDELLELYKKCKLFVSASLIEGFGLPLIEAAYLNASIICSDIPPYREILPESGRFFSAQNIGQISEFMHQYYGIENDYTKDIAKFSSTEMGAQLINCYSNTINYFDNIKVK